MGESRLLVILSEAMNPIISNESTMAILRLSPQNDIATQQWGQGEISASPWANQSLYPVVPPELVQSCI